LGIQNLLPSDAEVRELTTALVASGGGDASKDLALDLVLNQIVEQACLATGATGAAIALTRDGEMVCRATTGRNAPDLGVRLDNAGFSAECLRVGALQRCDDTETDPRVDANACRLLGVRSILVIPLWYWGEFMGIFEIFSPRPNAFGERDEQTLQALAYRVVRQTKQAAGSITGFTAPGDEIPVMSTPVPDPEPPTPIRCEPAAIQIPVIELPTLPPAPATPEPRDRWTLMLAAVAIIVACSIVGLMIWRVGWAGSEARTAAPIPAVVKARTPTPPAPAADAAANATQEEYLTLDPSALQPGSQGGSTAPAPKKNAPVANTPPAASATAKRGGLAIYEKGKLIYGSPIADPDEPPAQSTTASAKARTVQASATAPLPRATSEVPLRPVQLSAEIADNRLTNRVEPEYPDAARRARIQGSVMLDTIIGADGNVERVNPISGNVQLADAAARAVRQWRYKPYVVDGRKVPVHTQVRVDFMLAQ